MTTATIEPRGGKLELGDVRKDRHVRANSGLYAFGGVALLFFFTMVERDPTLLENTGLILAVIGIFIDVRTARHMKLMERPDEATARSREKKVFQTRWATFVTCRVATLSIVLFCGVAFAFGEVFMCWLHTGVDARVSRMIAAAARSGANTGREFNVMVWTSPRRLADLGHGRIGTWP